MGSVEDSEQELQGRLDDGHTRRTRTLHHLVSNFAKAPANTVRDDKIFILGSGLGTGEYSKGVEKVLTGFCTNAHTLREARFLCGSIGVSKPVRLGRAGKTHCTCGSY